VCRLLPLAAAALLGGAAVAQHAEERHTERIAVPDTPDESGKRPDLAAAARRIVDRTNAFRKEHGKAPVAPDADLTATARYFADHMAGTDEYGHTADGNTPGDRAKRHGYDYCLVLENIAYAFDSRGFEADGLADKFVTGWEKSPGHRKNMLDPDVIDTGVAVARSGKTGYYYAVQVFGRPKSAAFVFSVSNRAGQAVRYAIGGQDFDLAPRMTRTHTRCRPAELSFAHPGGRSETVTPTAGGRLVVTREGDRVVVRTEKD
jgi:uncharacterized protein YkwD